MQYTCTAYHALRNLLDACCRLRSNIRHVAEVLHVFVIIAGLASTCFATPVGCAAVDAGIQAGHERLACVACVWNEANALRVQHGLPLKEFHISLGPAATVQPGLSHLLPESPFQLDEHKLVQVSSQS